MNLGKVYILGDSYSTYEGCVPKGYDCYYADEIKSITDVCHQSETWWQQLITAAGGELFKNNSYSGTTVCNTGYNGADCTAISFIGRFAAEVKNGCFHTEQPNTFFIFGATNDYWAGSPLGSLQWEGWTPESLKCVFPAFCYLLHSVKQALPKTKIVVIINDLFNPEFAQTLVTACEKYAVCPVRLSNISKQGGHPDKLGMTQIFQQICSTLENN